MTDHPITPPLKLVQQWASESYGSSFDIATRAAQWGADQELEACEQWINSFQNKFVHAYDLRLVRRPKPPSFKRVALLQLDTLNADLGLEGKGIDLSQIRRALEQLDD